MTSGAGWLGGAAALASLAGGITGTIVGFREARELERRAITEARRIRRAGDRVLGAQTASYAHAGVTQQGTPQDVRNDTIAEIEREIFASNQNFEAASNQARNQAILALADSLSTSTSIAAETALRLRDRTTAGSKTATALYGRSTLGGTAPTLIPVGRR